jgi:hypothetical protein
MVACLVRDTSNNRRGMNPGPPARRPVRLLPERGVFDDEIAIDFPAVPAIVARICDSLSEEDQQPCVQLWGPAGR